MGQHFPPLTSQRFLCRAVQLIANLPPQPGVKGAQPVLSALSCGRMPRPLNERQALEEERAELAAQIAADQRELAETSAAQNTTRWEYLVWRIRRTVKRLAEVEARLARS